MKFADIFSGAGLFSAGFRQEGFKPVFAADLDSDSVGTYCKNIKPVAKVHDVTKVLDSVKADVLLAGPPCQGFSTLGRRDPLDVRNSMALVVPAWAKAMEAKVVIIENVPPFLESDYWREMTNELISDGYNIDTWVLNAAEHNTPQIRKRAFTIASKIGLPDMPSKRKEVPARKIFAKDISESDSLHVWPIHEGDSYQRILNVPYCGSKTDLMKSNPELCPESWFKMGKQATDVWGRINPDKPINTVRCSFQSPSKGRYLHPSENRVISLREGARFQGIPDRWQFVGSRTSIARQIGNGVPVPLARAIAKQVKSLFEAI